MLLGSMMQVDKSSEMSIKTFLDGHQEVIRRLWYV